ncbi:MAG: hypothetical protein H5U13_11695 [Parvibaculum sp.]|nr:hypothetical protein [Parvibaculum sp.]
MVDDPRDGRLSFRRGVSHLPTIGDPVLAADRHDLTRVYTQPNVATIEAGSLFQDAAVPARFVLDGHGHAYIVMLDVHNEYPTAFGDRAELIDPSNLNSGFSQSWSRPNLDRAGLEAIVSRWRQAGRERNGS